MKTTISYEFNSPAEAAAFLSQGAPAAAPPKPAATTQAAPLPSPGPVLYAAPPAAPAPAPQTFAPPPPPPPAAPAAVGPTATQVASVAQVYAKNFGPKAAKAVLGQFGITAISQATAEQLPMLLQHFSVQPQAA